MSIEMRSVEARLDKLEAQHRNLDAEVHGLARVCADIKNIALTNQHDIAGLTACVKALAEATHAGFKRADEQHSEFVKETRERFDRIEQQHSEFVKETRERFDRVDERFERIEKQHSEFEKKPVNVSTVSMSVSNASRSNTQSLKKKPVNVSTVSMNVSTVSMNVSTVSTSVSTNWNFLSVNAFRQTDTHNSAAPADGQQASRLMAGSGLPVLSDQRLISVNLFQ